MQDVHLAIEWTASADIFSLSVCNTTVRSVLEPQTTKA
jgi:hypothetical protein